MKENLYKDVLQRIEALIEGESDVVAVMSTISCELYQTFDTFSWVGFYRRVTDDTLKVGPYQGTHGCLTIDISRGVCGACVRENAIQLENDVSKAADHIACSSETKAEIVLPLRDGSGRVVAVLDVDSTDADVFDDCDVENLAKICAAVASRYAA